MGAIIFFLLLSVPFFSEKGVMERILSDKCYSYWYDPSKYIERLKYILSNNSLNERVLKLKLINL
jgi:hypothetical protein